MFRTRDFTLLATAISGLVCAIAGVLYFDIAAPFAQEASVFVASTEDNPTSAVVIENAGPARTDRLADLKEKIADRGGLLALATEEVTDTEEPAPSEDGGEIAPAAETETAEPERRCDYYRQGGIGWNSRGLLIDEVEGGRFVYREAAVDPSASSTTGVARDIVLQLPVRSVPSGNPSCIATDVIGIATDGSLIRNSEVGLYQVFGSGTLIGYALDGFPMYGSGSASTDECGGRIAGGQYRYELSSARDTIITCYAGAPIAI